MEYYEELTLIKINISQDEIGQPIKTETKREILAKPNLVGTKEFYNAMAVGIVPTAELRIRAIDYNNEEEVEYKGIRYSIIRTLPKDKLDVVLVIGTKQGING